MTDLPEILDGTRLAERLCMSKASLKKSWRKYPHFFVTDGRDLRGARFLWDEVLSYLLTQRSPDYDGGSVGRQEKGKNIPSAEDDPFNLLPASRK